MKTGYQFLAFLLFFITKHAAQQIDSLEPIVEDVDELESLEDILYLDEVQDYEVIIPSVRPKARRGSGSLINEGDFVQRSGTRFVVASKNDRSKCETFYFVGFNSYYLMLRAANPTTQYQVLEILDDAAAMGLTVLRTWAFSDGPLQWHSLQRYPAFYDEATLKGLDFLLHEASKRKIRVVLTFANYWQHYGGIDQYNIWSYQAGYGTCNGEFSCRDEFFLDDIATGFYKMHVRQLLLRKNTFNGRVYKDDPAIFGYNLMNEPRSRADLYVVTRESNDPAIGQYNITYNNGSTLQTWIEEVAEFVKTIDPVHLLTIGQEGFFGESTPLYLYANPGAWAAYQGNDFVLNHKVAGIDYATMHVYVDQWLCDIRGASRDGWLDFYQNWIESHQEAAEEELQMPIVLEEFGGKLEDNQRLDMFQSAFQSQLASARRGGSFGGVMFWVLYHYEYQPLNDFGGGYGMYLHSQSPQLQQINKIIYQQVKYLNEINSVSSDQQTCIWSPNQAQGMGCRSLQFQFVFGGMPWECLPGEDESINWCNARGRVDLYRDPPIEWVGLDGPEDLPFNTIEILVMGRIINTSTKIVNLKNAYFVIPFSGGVHTILEGLWERVYNPSERFEIFCWYLTVFDSEGESEMNLNLCDRSQSKVKFEFTELAWPLGVRQDRGLKVTILDDVFLNPGGYLAASEDSRRVMFSFKDESLFNRLDVASLSVTGSNSCPYSPRISQWPAPPPPPPPPCTEGKHPYRACPNLEWYKPQQYVTYLPVEQQKLPCQFIDCPINTYNPSTRYEPDNLIIQTTEIPKNAHVKTELQRPNTWTYEQAAAVLENIFNQQKIYNGTQNMKIKYDMQQMLYMKPMLVEGVVSLEMGERVSSKLGLSSRYLLNDATALAAGARGLQSALRNVDENQSNDSKIIDQIQPLVQEMDLTMEINDTEQILLNQLVDNPVLLEQFNDNFENFQNFSPFAEDMDLSEEISQDAYSMSSNHRNALQTSNGRKLQQVLAGDGFDIDKGSQKFTGTLEETFGRRRYLLQSELEFEKEDFASFSDVYDGFSLGLQVGEINLISARITASGMHRQGLQKLQSESKSLDDELTSEIPGLQFLGYEPQDINEDDLGRTSQDSANLEDSDAEARGGLLVLLTAEMKSQKFWGTTYTTIAKGVVIPNKDRVIVRGIFQIDKSIKDIQIYAEIPVAGLKVSLDRPLVQHPILSTDFVFDTYSPCSLDPDSSPDAIMLFEPEQTETWSVKICSRGYAQTLRIFKDGEIVVQFGEGFGFWELEEFPVQKGSRYHFLLDGQDHGLPYGSYRGGSGIHIKRTNGKPFQTIYDAEPAKNNSQKFVYAKDGKFWLGCNQFTYVGANTWDLLDISRYQGRLKEVDARFDAMKNNNLTVARIWSFLVGRGTTKILRDNRLQLKPGYYNESVFRNLDYILDAARKRDMKLIIAIEDFWLSLTPYIDWVDSMSFKTDFYTDWRARQIYKLHMKKLVHRVNTYNGIKYLDDPVILAWNLINEPRCTNCGGALQAWIDEMALHLNALDPNHMITIGEEGFYSSTCQRVHINPGAGTRRTGIGSSPWALQEGQDFLKNHQSPHIDFATVHIWSDNWLGHVDFCGYINQNKGFDYSFGCELWKEKLDYTQKWLQTHILDARKLGKPLIVEEFGKTILADKIQERLLRNERAQEGVELRNWFFKTVYNEIEKDMMAQGNTQGSNFWNFYLGQLSEEDPYRVTPQHNSTLQIIKHHAQQLTQIHLASICN